MKQNEKLAQPFFAQFLEAQKKQAGTEQNNAEGWPGVTLPFVDQVHTMKYPSDGDDDLPTI